MNTMATININRDTMNKLTHQSIEIRVRTLEQISSKVNRALELNESIDFKPGDLCKKLIRWFGFVPLQQPLKVLNLLKSVIESPKYGSKAIDKLGSERIIKEFKKIEALFDSQSAEFNIINEIKEFLRTASLSKENYKIRMRTEDLENLIQCASSMKIDEELSEYSSEDYETPWSRPTPSDYTSMKFLSDILINKFASNVEIENAVCHLQLTMGDYPVEYLLQSPHIFRNLLQMYDIRKNCENHHIYIDNVAAALMQFLFALEKRLKMLRKSISFNHGLREHSSTRKKDSETPCQLKVEKALTELFEASVFHFELYSGYRSDSSVVWEVIFMVLKLLQYIKRSVDPKSLYQISSAVANLSLKFAETNHCARLRLHQMLLILLLQDIAHDNVCPTSLKALEVFEPILRDYTMKSFFPKRHKHIEEFVLKTDNSMKVKYKLLTMHEWSYEKSIQLLKNKSTSYCGDIIREGHSVCSVLDMLQSKELVDILFDGVIKCIPLYQANDEIKTQAIDLLLKLLNLTFMPLKIYAYEKVTDALKRHIGCLMTGERYSMECSNADLLKSHIVGVPLNTELLMQLVHHCFESFCEQIQTNCCKILELFLKSQTLFGTHWNSLLPIVVPLLPLLNCCTFSAKIMDLLLKLFDPDIRQLPYICVLQGNIGFLFHSNADRRSEALIRLIYTLNSIKGAENYAPHLSEISDTIPNDICFQNAQREYRNMFSDHLPVRCDATTSLYNLLYLLESPDVEPLIRKTTLMQINILCSNWHITSQLCDANAFYLILQALENALQKSPELDYADAAVPAISILNKVMLYDSSVRCELAETPNIYVLLLRALMMFHYDIQARQDATMCLFQLLYSSQLISTENCIEGPLILGNIKVPVNINFRSALSNKIQQDRNNVSNTFVSGLEEIRYWRMVVASSYFDGLKNITQKSTALISQLDVGDELKLTTQDVRFIRATQPNISLHRLIKAALNATDHRSLIQACKVMKQQLILFTLKYTFFITDDFCMKLNNILRRYLQMSPGNADDLNLYEQLIDVAKICLRIPLELVALEIYKMLHKDSRHALVTMLLQDEGFPLQIYNKITDLLKFLINKNKHVFENHFNPSECSSFYSNLFDLIIERCLKLFEIRDLQRVRCLLSLLVAISSCQLNAPDQLLLFYCRRFVQLSSALKSFTQTGAQWHRDCLLAILQLCDQMQKPNENFRLTASIVKYLSGLCGHNDLEVRTIAWSILYVTAKTKAIDSTVTTSVDISGIELLINELSYLPGGFMACCLSTLLDAEEAISVRHLAGHMLAVLIRTHGQVAEIERLLAQHYFTRLATEALTLSVCILEVEIPKEMHLSTINITTCDILSCYSLIYIAISHRSPAFLNKLCTKSFMFKLYEVLKQPPPLSKHIGYLNMIGHICRLYTLCNSENFLFLQRTICRDAVWLGCFCQILFEIAAPSNEMYIIFNMLQLFLILCKDSTALEQLSIKLRDYSMDIVILFQDALNVKHIKTSLQSCCLSILTLFLVKSQPQVDADLSVHILTLFESPTISIKSIRCNAMFDSDNKENNNNYKKEKSYEFEKEIVSVVKSEIKKSSISEHLCIALIRLFTHLYPVKVCEFSTPPNVNQQHVTETLAVLLKQSPVAQETAQNLKFQDKLVKIFKQFFDEFATTSCTTYLKRNGENKKLAVIKNLQLLLKLLISWHSSPSMLITDNILAMDYSKIVIKIWPWLAHSNDLKLTVLQVCSFLSERSLVVCKQFSTLNNSSFPHSVLQLVAKMMSAETLKIKANSTDCSTLISAGLRVVMNCCSCLEGRTVLNKLHALDVFDSLYPFNPKASQLKLDIVIAWLEFWELFSRYEEGAQSHHLNALCSVVNKSSPGCSKRLISLRILRNMVFLNKNRSTLITSTDFIFTINEIVSQPIKESVEEQFIMCVALWKLITSGIKFIAMIRGTKLEIKKSSISEHLCIALIRLFTHLYPVKVCEFSTPPNVNQQHVTETLAVLLKQSPVAQETAQNLKFQDKLVKIFKQFFDEFATTSCTTYLKRNGENKKLAVIKNLQLLLKLLISWHSSPSMLITDNILAMDYSKIVIKIWPWLAHSNDLKLTVLQVCSFLSERSLVVCKQFSTLNNSSFPHSVLQLVAKMMSAETLKIKANSTDCSTLISAGLRVVMNCCSCLEGRTVLNKLHALDVFDSLYPFNPKASQLKLDIVIAWLEFWELFSRYEEGAQSHHLNALCSVVNKSSPGCSKRLISLRILRNMVFLNKNRSTLITSTDFIFTINEIVSQPIKESVEEQFIMCVALWKLITSGIKFIAMIRGTKLGKNLQLLKENLTCTNAENDEAVKFSNDLLNVLNIIFKIFNN